MKLNGRGQFFAKLLVTLRRTAYVSEAESVSENSPNSNLRSSQLGQRMTEEEALEGFPVSARERLALTELCGEGGRLPKGVGPQTRQNLVARKWIRQTGIDEEYVPVFATTPEGIIALQIDDLALKRGRQRPSPVSSMARPGAYQQLAARLNLLRGDAST
jgi:hypothetical protein